MEQVDHQELIAHSLPRAHLTDRWWQVSCRAHRAGAAQGGTVIPPLFYLCSRTGLWTDDEAQAHGYANQEQAEEALRRHLPAAVIPLPEVAQKPRTRAFATAAEVFALFRNRPLVPTK